MMGKTEVVCWRCQRAGKGVQLQNVRLPAINPKTGKPLKSDDYICTKCIAEGYYKPETWNTSRFKHPSQEELDEMLKEIQKDSPDSSEQPVKEAEKEEPPAGDGFKDFTQVTENIQMQLEPPVA